MTLRNYYSREDDRVVGMVEDVRNKVVAASLVREKGHASTSCHNLSELHPHCYIHHFGY